MHTEHKKKPCVKKEELVAQKNEELLIYTQKSQKNEQNNVKKHIFIDNIHEQEIQINNMQCEHCNKIFKKKYNLNK